MLAKNFHVQQRTFDNIPEEQLFILQAHAPKPIAESAVASPQGTVPKDMVFRLMAGDPIRSERGWTRVADSTNFPISTDVAASLVEVEPGGMREIHWHLNADEWQYYISGKGRMTVFASQNRARTFDFREGDVGYVPRSMSHYVENTGDQPLRYLELFRANKYTDVSLHQWLALTPSELVRAHLKLDEDTLASLNKVKRLVV